MCAFLFVYTISISIICVSQEECSFIPSNQQMCDFYKWVIFKKKRLCEKLIFDISELFNVIQIVVVVSIWQVVLILIHIGVSVCWPLHVVCVFVCVFLIVCLCVYVCLISNQSTSKKPHVSDLSKLDALYKSQLGPSGIKVIRFDMYRCIILSGTSNVAQSPILPKK